MAGRPREPRLPLPRPPQASGAPSAQTRAFTPIQASDSLFYPERETENPVLGERDANDFSEINWKITTLQ